jgi:predicted RNA-binding protein with PUA-like domain
MRYWLMKSEPDEFSIDALRASPGKTATWDGVRNYQVRNMIRDQMRRGDLAFFYHSSCAQPGIVGTMAIQGPAQPDRSAFDPRSKYFDPDSKADTPRWYSIEVRLQRKFKRLVSLEELRSHAALADMLVLRRGNWLSITPVTPNEWAFINDLTR